MTDLYKNPELEALFKKYQANPTGQIFAPLADACRKEGMVEEALEITERGVRQHPAYTSGLVVHAKCLYDAGRPDEAYTAFEKVLSLDDNNLVALRYLGTLSIQRGDHTSARRYLNHILEFDPDNSEIAADLEALAIDEQRTAEVLRATTADLDDDPTDDLMSGDDGGDASVDDAADAEEDNAHDDVTHIDAETSDDEASSAPAPEVAVTGSSSKPEERFEGKSISLGQKTGTSDAFATRTLADIYAAQGYKDRARRIYEDLIGETPDDESLRVRWRELGGQDEDLAETAVSRSMSTDTHQAPTPNPVATSPAASDQVAADEAESSFSHIVETMDDDADVDVNVEDLVDLTASVSETVLAQDVEEHPEAAAAPSSQNRPKPTPAPRATSSATAEPEDAPASPQAAEDASAAPGGRDQQSYEQFKRWLKNISDK